MGVFNRLLFENKRLLCPYCFLEMFVGEGRQGLDGGRQSRDGGSPSPPLTRENPAMPL